MLDIDPSDVKQYEKDLQQFARSAFPHATKATLNKAAFETRKRGQMNIRWNMTTRNRFTEQSVQVEMAKGMTVESQQAVVGSTAEYMHDQEFGATVRGKGASKAIPTAYSAGQADGTRPRSKLPRKPNQMQSIQLKRQTAGKNVWQRNRIAIQMAAESGSKFVYLELGRTKGIFRVLGGKRKPRIRMVWSLSRRAVTVPKNPWLGPATDDTRQDMPRYYRDALLYQLKRQNILGY